VQGIKQIVVPGDLTTVFSSSMVFVSKAISILIILKVDAGELSILAMESMGIKRNLPAPVELDGFLETEAR
jgi:hypothetical protein